MAFFRVSQPKSLMCYMTRVLTGNFNIQGTHKAMHKKENSIVHTFFTPKIVSKPDPETGDFNPFPSFSFTGPLRPIYPLSAKREIPKSIPWPDYATDGIPKLGARTLMNRNKVELLDKKSQDAMRKVCRLAREVLDIAAAALRPGITTDEIDQIVHDECIKRNVSASGTSRGSRKRPFLAKDRKSMRLTDTRG